MWRNWQTRRSQKPVMETSWRFKSSHPHQKVSKFGESVNRTRLFSVYIYKGPSIPEGALSGYPELQLPLVLKKFATENAVPVSK